MIRSYVRGRQGIYALYHRDKLYYVGLAINLRTRLKQHLRNRHKKLWDRFSIYLTIGDSHLRELESLILRTIKPPGNHQSAKFIKSENLRGRLSRELRTRQRQEINWVIGPLDITDSKKAPETAPKRRTDSRTLLQPIDKTASYIPGHTSQSSCAQKRSDPIQEQRLQVSVTCGISRCEETLQWLDILEI